MIIWHYADGASIHLHYTYGNSLVSTVTSLRAGQSTYHGSNPGRCKRLLSVSCPDRLRPIRPLIQLLPGPIYPGVMQRGWKAGHSPLSSVEVQKEWSRSCTPPSAWLVQKERDNAFTQPSYKPWSPARVLPRLLAPYTTRLHATAHLTFRRLMSTTVDVPHR